MVAPWCLLDEPYSSRKKESFEYGNIERGGEENRLAEPAYQLYTPTTPCSAGSHVTASNRKGEAECFASVSSTDDMIGGAQRAALWPGMSLLYVKVESSGEKECRFCEQ